MSEQPENRPVINKRAAYGALAAFLTSWSIIGPGLFKHMPMTALAMFAGNLLLVIGLGVLALRGRLDNPASIYRRAVFIGAIVAIGAGAIYTAYVCWQIWFG